MSDCRDTNIRNEAFSYYPQLGQLSAYCAAHYRKKITLSQAADVVGLRDTYFSTFFHEKVGVCFSCWLSLLRVEHAKQMLRDSNQTISRIALEVGFNNLASFERSFKRCTGGTASQYKNQVRPC